jgi:hypothetical protein
MRHVLFPLLSAAVVLGLVAGGRAADADVKAVLEKAIKAHGGEEALNKYKAGQSRTAGKLKIPNIGEVDFTGELATMQPDKLKEKTEFEIMNVKVSVATYVNGDTVAIVANGNEVPITDAIKESLASARHLMKTARLVSLVKDKEVELSALPETKVEGKPAAGVLVKAKGFKDVSLYFDKETGLLARVDHVIIEPMTGQEIKEERIILEYNKPGKEGLPLPKKIRLNRDGEKYLEVEVTEAKVLEKLDDAEFTKP